MSSLRPNIAYQLISQPAPQGCLNIAGIHSFNDQFYFCSEFDNLKQIHISIQLRIIKDSLQIKHTLRMMSKTFSRGCGGAGAGGGGGGGGMWADGGAGREFVSMSMTTCWLEDSLVGVDWLSDRWYCLNKLASSVSIEMRSSTTNTTKIRIIPSQ